jgi:DNA-binding XRE family transcriptional regulator
MKRPIKLLLIEKSLRNFDLAKHLDCDPAKVSKIVNGWIDPDLETKQKIAEFLGVDQAEIWK